MPDRSPDNTNATILSYNGLPLALIKAAELASRKLPWHGRLALALAVLAMVLHFVSWLGGALGL